MTRPFLFAKLIWENIRETAKQIYLCITFVFVFSIEEKDTHQLKKPPSKLYSFKNWKDLIFEHTFKDEAMF